MFYWTTSGWCRTVERVSRPRRPQKGRPVLYSRRVCVYWVLDPAEGFAVFYEKKDSPLEGEERAWMSFLVVNLFRGKSGKPGGRGLGAFFAHRVGPWRDPTLAKASNKEPARASNDPSCALPNLTPSLTRKF